MRGYRPSELRGDGGTLLTGEVRHPFQVANRLGILSFFYNYGMARFQSTPGGRAEPVIVARDVRLTRDGRETHWYSKYEGAVNSVKRTS